MKEIIQIFDLLSVVYVGVCVVTVFFAILTLCVLNNVLAVFFLVTTYFFAVWLLAFLNAEFIAFVILVVYLGAITVLFLFIVMLLPVQQQFDNNVGSLQWRVSMYLLMTAYTPLLYCVNETVYVVEVFTCEEFAWKPLTTERLAFALYSDHFVAFILCGLLLLFGIIACIRLSLLLRSPKLLIKTKDGKVII